MKLKSILRDSREIADYIDSISSDDIDREMIEEEFLGCQAILERVAVASLKPGHVEANLLSRKKQATYNKLPIEEAPPILIENGKIWDGHHRYRAAIKQEAEMIWAYRIVDGSPKG